MSTHEPTKHKDTVEVTMGNAHIKALDLGGHESARKVRRGLAAAARAQPALPLWALVLTHTPPLQNSR
jgi:hypothetical protein